MDLSGKIWVSFADRSVTMWNDDLSRYETIDFDEAFRGNTIIPKNKKEMQDEDLDNWLSDDGMYEIIYEDDDESGDLNESFKADYLMEEEDEDLVDMNREPETDDEFSVDSYDEDQLDTDEELTDEDKEDLVADYEMDIDDEDSMEDDESDEDIEIDVDELYSKISELFPDEDEEKVKDWIEGNIETKNIQSMEEFLDQFENAEEMENSFKEFGTEETEVESEQETDDEEDEIVEESKKSKKKINEGGGAGVEFDFSDCEVRKEKNKYNVYGNLKLSSYEDYKELTRDYNDFVGELLITKQMIRTARMDVMRNLKRESSTNYDISIKPDISISDANFVYSGGYIRADAPDQLDISVSFGFYCSESSRILNHYEYIELEVPMIVSQDVKYLYDDLDNDLGSEEDEIVEESKKQDCKFIITYKNEKGKEKVKKLKAKSKAEANRKFKEEFSEFKIVKTEKEELKEAYSKDVSDMVKDLILLKDSKDDPKVKQEIEKAIRNLKTILKMPEEKKEKDINEVSPKRW